jgi:O-succinylbenzoic acid--CoA ligase
MFFTKIQEHNPSSPAVITGNKAYSYFDLIEECKSCCRKLKQFNINAGDHAAIICNNEFEFILLVFAIWNSRGVPVLLNTKLSAEEIQREILFADCKFTFVHQKLVSQINLAGIKTIEFPLTDNGRTKGNLILQQTSNNDTAVIIFTSGSSGKPKAVMLSFENLMQSALIGNKVLEINSKDRLLASLPFYHIGGFSIIIRTLMFGSSLLIPNSLSGNDLIESLKLFKPTITSLVSNQLKKLVDEKITPPKELRLILLGGGFFSKGLILKAVSQGWKTAKVYGSTETSSFITFMNFEESKIRPAASGKAISPNRILITDQGEIAILSPSLMKGYYNNKDEDVLKLKDGFFYTGDIGYVDNEGYLYIKAKRNDLIVSGGENINPIEVEKQILTHPKVIEVSVVGVEDKEWGQIVSAAVILKENENLTEDELKTFLKKKTASFKIPKQIIFVNNLPKTELGKVQREKVRKLFRSKTLGKGI